MGVRLAAWPYPKARGMTLANRIRAYIPMCDVTYSEMMDMISTEIARFGYPVEDFDLETPAELRLFQWCFAGTKEDAAPGYFHMSFYPKVKGVTVYGHILDAVHNTRGERRRKDGFWEKMRSSACYDGMTRRFVGFVLHGIRFQLKPWRKMCRFAPSSTIQKSLEQEIKKGRVRKIYEISLGYIFYCEPGVYVPDSGEYDYADIFYYVKPMWRVNCLKASGAQQELEEAYRRTMNAIPLPTRSSLWMRRRAKSSVQSDAADRSMFPGYSDRGRM